jgi:hypothetical protein
LSAQEATTLNAFPPNDAASVANMRHRVIADLSGQHLSGQICDEMEAK